MLACHQLKQFILKKTIQLLSIMSDHGGGSDASPSSVPSGAGQEPTIPPSKSSDRIAQSTPDSPTPDQKPVKPGDTDVNEPNTTTPLGNDNHQNHCHIDNTLGQ